MTGIATALIRLTCAALLALPVAGAHANEASEEIGIDSKPPLGARQVLARAYRNLYDEDYIQELHITTSMRGGQGMSRTLQITRRQSVRPGQALLRFTKPRRIRRTSVLIKENETSSDDLWVYLPSLGKTKRLSASQRSDAFFGTDLSYEDVEPKRVEDYEVADLGDGEHEGRPCRMIEQRAKPPFESEYERMVSCVEEERGVIFFTDFYDDGEAVKRLEVDAASVRAVDDLFIPFLMTMKTHRGGSETRVVTQRYDVRPDIPDRIFSTWNLESGDAERDRTRAGTSAKVLE